MTNSGNNYAAGEIGNYPFLNWKFSASHRIEFVASISHRSEVWRPMPLTDDIHGNIFPTCLAQPVLSTDRYGVNHHES